ncbi:hypothetical protein [Actinomadura madurae]|uniref:hypothetical protein n=1 Tax=Actinomadura madurae TaxID=1993 RepID=UPI0020D23178|nr:hypothetical protein [Actinomadura madurae]MCP9979062.1 hypothetical protein [Actinomadura madurae]
MLGPKGHVPEEFLDFGDAAAGRTVTLRTRVTVPGSGGFPLIGFPAAKTLTADGTEIPWTTTATWPWVGPRFRPATTSWNCAWSPRRTCGSAATCRS